jgi:hypothetical protein
MLIRSTSGKHLLPILLTLSFVIGSIVVSAEPPDPTPRTSPVPQTPDCSKATDAEIVKAVVDNINKR